MVLDLVMRKDNQRIIVFEDEVITCMHELFDLLPCSSCAVDTSLFPFISLNINIVAVLSCHKIRVVYH
jgi:hypothetical protein